MIIAVCAKITPDPESVSVDQTGKPNTGMSVWGVSEYDLQAIQAAQEMSRAGDEVVAISAGTTAIAKPRLTKSLMSKGNLQSLIRIADDGLADADSAVYARVLASAIKRAGADVVLFGEGSSDRYARSMGAQVAAELDWPSFNAVDRIDMEDQMIVIERDVEDGIEVVEVIPPCALSVTSTINVPVIPTMKAVLDAGKKPVEDLDLADLEIEESPTLELVSTGVPAQPGRLQVMLTGSPEEIAAQLVDKLKADQVL